MPPHHQPVFRLLPLHFVSASYFQVHPYHFITRGKMEVSKRVNEMAEFVEVPGPASLIQYFNSVESEVNSGWVLKQLL